MHISTRPADTPHQSIDARPMAEIRGAARERWRRERCNADGTRGRSARRGGGAGRIASPRTSVNTQGAAGAALDPSAAAVAVYGCAQMVFAYRAFRRARASDEPGREAALGRGFLLIFLWHASHFLAHEFKKPWAWFGLALLLYLRTFPAGARAELDARRGAAPRRLPRGRRPLDGVGRRLRSD